MNIVLPRPVQELLTAQEVFSSKNYGKGVQWIQTATRVAAAVAIFVATQWIKPLPVVLGLGLAFGSVPAASIGIGALFLKTGLVVAIRNLFANKALELALGCGVALGGWYLIDRADTLIKQFNIYPGYAENGPIQNFAYWAADKLGFKPPQA